MAENKLEQFKDLIGSYGYYSLFESGGGEDLDNHLNAQREVLNFTKTAISENPNFVRERDEVSKTALFYALHNINYEVAKELIDAGAEFGAPLEIRAAARAVDLSEPKEKQAFEDLFDSPKLDMNVRDSNGETVMFYASKGREVGFLLKHGADIDAKNNNGETPLMHMINFGVVDVVQNLVEKGADLNVTNANGLNLLQHAISNEVLKSYQTQEKLDCIKILLNAGMDPRKLNRDGDSALDYAKAGENQDVRSLVESKAQELTMREKHGITNDRPRSRGRGQEL